MKIRNLDIENKDKWLKVTDLENAFDIYIDDHGDIVYNLNQTVYIDVDPSQLKTYVCDCNGFWPLFSYKIYGTTRLAWLLMKLNNVKASEMFDMKHASDKIVYIDKELMQGLIANINEFDD